jgi:hypothetical protein
MTAEVGTIPALTERRYKNPILAVIDRRYNYATLKS